MQGQLLAGRYRLADAIGSGGMGRVWRAHDEVLHRAVAIKELTAALYVSESEQELLLARTRAEARAAARINHSAVVTVHDVLEHDARPWIVMELVEGHSLADAVKERGRIEPREAARVGLWVLRALRAAHTAGVLHRDIKPGNVLLAEDGRVLLTDFGIAQIEGDTTITRTGEVVGSVDYLAPERIRGHDPGPASDLWALGATLYTAVEGRSPFRRTSPLSTMQAVVEEEATQPAHAGPLGPAIAALLHKDPAARPDAVAAEQMLAEAAEGRRPDAAQAYVPTGRVPDGLDPGTATTTPYGSGTTPYGAGTTPYAPSTTPYGSGTTPNPHGAPSRPHPHGTAPQPGPHGTAPQPGPHGTAPQPHASGPGGGSPSKRRRGLRTLALLVALAAVVAGGTAVALHWWEDGRRAKDTSASPTPTTGGTPSKSPQSNVPAGWETVEDPLGFSLSLPKGWKRSNLQKDGDLTQVDYSPDGGKHILRIAMDTAPDFNDANAHLTSLDWQLGQRLVDYQRLSLERKVYRDMQASRMEWTWTALPKDTDFPGPYRAVDQMYIAGSGVEYAFYMASPTEDWPTTQKRFETVLQGWREP